MLTAQEEDRIEAALPDTVSVSYDGATHTYDLGVFWSGGNTNEEYPTVVFEWDVQNELRPERQPANNLVSIDNPVDEPGATETKTDEVSDDLSITVAVEAVFDDGLPPQVRRKQIAQRIWKFFEQEADFTDEGPNGERPMRIETLSGITPARVEDTLRAEWPVRIHHSELYEEEIETADDASFETNQTDN